jgi:hypothetical protein
MKFLNDVDPFWCIILGIVVAMLIHHLLSKKNIIEGQVNQTGDTQCSSSPCCELQDDGTCINDDHCDGCIYNYWLPISCYNTCKCDEHEGTPRELISKQLGINGNSEDNMYADITGREFRKDSGVTFSNATHFRCYADRELVNYSMERARSVGVSLSDIQSLSSDLSGEELRVEISNLIIQKVEADAREAEEARIAAFLAAEAAREEAERAAAEAAAAAETERVEAERIAAEAAAAAAAAEAERLATEEAAAEAARIAEEQRLEEERIAREEAEETARIAEEQRIEQERIAAEVVAAEEAARIAEEQRIEQERIAEEQRNENIVSSAQDNLLKSHSESGMCTGSKDYKYYGNRTGVAQENSTGEGKGYYETSVGTCAQKRSCNFCCGITATGPDGVMKNYGPHCREGQCGAGPFPSVHERNNDDQKSGWTDCNP